MKKRELSLLTSVAMLVLMAALSGQPDDALLWTDRGCDASYTVDDLITVYFVPEDGEEYELWAYDALMNAQLLSEGVGNGQTLNITVTAYPPLGPLTFVFKMPCKGECELCDMCDYGQCTVTVVDPCADHCTNRIQDCGEYGVDCGGGCPVKDADSDGVEDCMDLCLNSKCDKVDENGCETDADGDGVTDCDDECPDEKGDPSNRGCPHSNNLLIVGGIGVAVFVGGLAVWRMKSRKH